MKTTTLNTTKRSRNWFICILFVIIAGVMLLVDFLIENPYLLWGAVLCFIIAIWCAVVATVQKLESMSNS